MCSRCWQERAKEPQLCVSTGEWRGVPVVAKYVASRCDIYFSFILLVKLLEAQMNHTLFKYTLKQLLHLYLCHNESYFTPTTCWTQLSCINFGCSLVYFFFLAFCFSVFPYFYSHLKIQQMNFTLPFAFLTEAAAGRRVGPVNMKQHMCRAAITYWQTFFGLSHIWQCSHSCGDVDSHDLTRLIRLFAGRHLQALTRLNLRLFLPTPIRRNRRKLGPWLFKWF